MLLTAVYIIVPVVEGVRGEGRGGHVTLWWACHSLITGPSFELDIPDLRRRGEEVGMTSCIVGGDDMVVKGTVVALVGMVSGVRQAPRPSFSKTAS